MNLSSIFLGRDGRIRSGWRFVIFIAGFTFSVAILFVLAALLLRPLKLEGATATLANALAFFLPILISALFVGWLCNRLLDGSSLRALGASFTAGWFKNFVVGALIGTITLCLAVGIGVALGGLSFTTDQIGFGSIAQTLVLSLLIFIANSAAEEALFRGYPMQTFFHSDLKLFGVIFTGVLFATTHVGNPSADFLSWLNTFIAGIWFGVAYWKSGDLWLPFGMHLMWNWMQGAFFGIEVSGLTDITSAPLLKEIDRGPAWLTGETYGIEAGVACTAALVISTIVIYFLPKKESVDQPVQAA
jgi:membrane protease YdiL (CAAX protease family)